MSKTEFCNGLWKGLGRRPTKYLFRWSPTWKNPFRLDLLEVSKCRTDGGIVTPTMPQSLRPIHAGHHIEDPKLYSLWELMKVQLRIVR